MVHIRNKRNRQRQSSSHLPAGVIGAPHSLVTRAVVATRRGSALLKHRVVGASVGVTLV
jgi:hypothetical protein